MVELSDFLSQPGNILSICSLGVAIAAIIIAYRSPARTEKIKTVNQARQIHFNKIKEGCLQPLLAAIDNVSNAFHLSEFSRYDKNWILRQQQEGLPDIITLKSWVSLKDNTYGTNIKFEILLYEDLGNHFPELKKEIDSVQKFLDDNYPTYHKEWT